MMNKFQKNAEDMKMTRKINEPMSTSEIRFGSDLKKKHFHK